MIDNDRCKAALEVRFDSDAGDNLTVREYLHCLLQTMWQEGEGFSGKRPFGNSGWEYDLYIPLVRNGFIQGTWNEEFEDADGIDKNEAFKFVETMIWYSFFGGSH